MANTAEETTTQRLLKGLRHFVIHPLGHLLLFLLFLYQIKEFYPFTHVPMYSDPEGRAPYMYLADGDEKAVAIRSHCGVTNPKLRKMYRSRMEDHCSEHDINPKEPPPQAIRTVAEDVVLFLRERAEVRGRPLPNELRIMHVLIEPAPAPEGFRETTTRITEKVL